MRSEPRISGTAILKLLRAMDVPGESLSLWDDGRWRVGDRYDREKAKAVSARLVVTAWSDGLIRHCGGSDTFASFALTGAGKQLVRGF